MSSFGYIRVSNDKSTVENQRKILKDSDYIVDNWIVEHAVSGSIPTQKRLAFSEMMKIAKAGDTILTTTICRLGRSALDILSTVEYLKSLGIRLRILQLDGVDLTSGTGRLLLTMLAAVAEVERDFIISRTNAGLARAKEDGVIMGRPMSITPDMLTLMVVDRNGPANMTFQAISEKYNVGKNTVHLNITKWGTKLQDYKNEYEKRQTQYLKKSA